jgi:uncharacterized protein involved in exopolysaccharide biosynthesis
VEAAFYDMGQAPDLVQEDGWDIVRKGGRRKWLVAGVTLGFSVAGAGAAMMMTPRYSAEVRVLGGVPDPHVANIEAVLKNILPNTETTQSEAYIIGSRDVAQKVVYRLALAKSPEFNPAQQPPDGWRNYLSPGGRLAALAALVTPEEDEAAAADDAQAPALSSR